MGINNRLKIKQMNRTILDQTIHQKIKLKSNNHVNNNIIQLTNCLEKDNEEEEEVVVEYNTTLSSLNNKRCNNQQQLLNKQYIMNNDDNNNDDHKLDISNHKTIDYNNSKHYNFHLNNLYNNILHKFNCITSHPGSKGAFAVILYGTVSLCQTIFNKKVMHTYQMQASNLMLFCQMLVSIIVLQSLKHLNILKLNTTIDYQIIKKLTPLSICYVMYVVLGLDSLKTLNIPMYSALKRLVAVIIILMEYFILGKMSPPRIVMSVCVMVVGAVVAGITDLTFNAVGYTLVMLSCVFQASYLVYVKKVTTKDMSMYDLLYLNSVLSLPFIGTLMLVYGEVQYFIEYPHLKDTSFQIYFGLSVVIGFILNFCIFFCTATNSALTTSVTGQIKNIASTVVGAIIFQDIIIHPINIIGLLINMIGSIWYSLLKLS